MSEIGLLAVTRGVGGAGIGLLLAGRVPEEKRKVVGWGLFALGALSTVPLLIDVIRKSSNSHSAGQKGAKSLPNHNHQTKPRPHNRTPISAGRR